MPSQVLGAAPALVKLTSVDDGEGSRYEDRHTGKSRGNVEEMNGGFSRHGDFGQDAARSRIVGTLECSFAPAGLEPCLYRISLSWPDLQMDLSEWILSLA
jgi:hypothetical protein